jgi:16S rRNA (guanine966-N2)-methyltransferase
LRVIGGSLKGRKLVSVKGNAIRPTADRVRESIFNILGARVEDATVLDIFAGTGALGIEALSRGAKSAVFIDINKAALEALAGNLKICGLESRSRLIRWDALKRLGCLHGLPSLFDLVLMDPPYRQAMIPPTLNNLHESHCLKIGAELIIEHAPHEPVWEKEIPFAPLDQRRYGKTLVSFLEYML